MRYKHCRGKRNNNKKKNPRTRDNSKTINNGLSLRVVTVNVKYHGNERTKTVDTYSNSHRLDTQYTRTVCRNERLAAPTPTPTPGERKARFNGIEVSNPPEPPKPCRPLITFTFRIAWLKNGALIRCSFEPLMDFHIESALIRIKTN